jgi:hypothetical protein
MALGRVGFASAVLVLLLPEFARALPGLGETGFTPLAQVELQNAVDLNSTPFGFAPNNAVGHLWMATPFATLDHPTLTVAAALIEASTPPAFDIGGYDAMWDDTWFSEMAAYGGLDRDALRVTGMEALNGVYSQSGTIPYGRLTLQREFQEGHHIVGLGAYGLHLSVRPTAISGFGDDSYTDVAMDGTYRWIAHPEREVSETISAHVLILHEGEDLIASHAVLGTNATDALTVFRGDLNYSWGAAFTPGIQYFQITGTSDPVRLGTLDGSPDSKGWIAAIGFAPWSKPDSPLRGFNVRLALQFIAYSEFDGASRNASANNTVLLHVSVGADPDF